jgi:cytochrome b subunit of formate dehydrogenase
MNAQKNVHPDSAAFIKVERTFQRFTLGQRWEHALLILSVTALLLTGLPQKYQNTDWSQWIISSPDRLSLIQQIHHIFALLLTAEVIYHLARGIYLLARRQLPGAIFPTWQDVRDAWQTFLYLLFLTKKKPSFGKYNFEQKFTYWFLFFGIGILVTSGFILWFPLVLTRFLPGGIVPAAYLTHSNEAIAAAVFIVIWHFYHVHLQRLNLSIFTGRLSEEELRTFHATEYERLIAGEDVKEEIKNENQGGGL